MKDPRKSLRWCLEFPPQNFEEVQGSKLNN